MKELHEKHGGHSKKKNKKYGVYKHKPSVDQVQQIIRKDQCIEIFKSYQNENQEELYEDQNIE